MDLTEFVQWSKLKMQLSSHPSTPKIIEGEVWWCSLGRNLGVEMNGKSSLFSRPVLVYKKLGSLGFIGIPFTSKIKTGSWYTGIVFHDKKQTVVLSQIRILSVARLSSRMGTLDIADFERVRKHLLQFLTQSFISFHLQVLRQYLDLLGILQENHHIVLTIRIGNST